MFSKVLACIIAEDFSERADLRDKLRRIYKKSGRLIGTKIESEKKAEEPRTEAVAVEATVPSEVRR